MSTFSLCYQVSQEKLCNSTNQGERIAEILFVELVKCLLKSAMVLWDLKDRLLCTSAFCVLHLCAIIALKEQTGWWVSPWLKASACKDEAHMCFSVSEVLSCGVEHPVYHIPCLIPDPESVFRD